jgi:hypothetical protein
MIKRNSLYIYSLIGLSTLMTVAEVAMNLEGQEVSDSTAFFWGAAFIILSIVWANKDAKTNNFEKPFDFGFLVYVFWPVAFPWYLVKTRGIDGVLIFLGFLFIWAVPSCFGLVAYVYFS